MIARILLQCSIAGIDGAFVSNPADTNLAVNLGSPGYVNPVPVPVAVWLFGTASAGFAGIARKKIDLNEEKR